MNNPQPQNQIAFIDAAVVDPATLIAGLAPGTEVVMLQPDSDGLGQIAAALAGRSNLQSIHLISHGSNGQIQLGSTSLSGANLAQYQSTLQDIGSHLSASGDILIYGCDVAAGAQGQNLVQQIAQITQADVAASTTLTGAAALGGDWVLEYQQGNIENGALNIANYSGTMVLPAGLYIQGDGSGGGGGGAAIANDNTLGSAGGAGGTGGGGDGTLTGGALDDVIFGDGSGGGGGGMGAQYSGKISSTGAGGAGGGGADRLNGGAGNDILFGDGFNGFDGGVVTAEGQGSGGGKGGLGGSGGGGTGGNAFNFKGGLDGLGGGVGGTYKTSSLLPLVSGFGNIGGSAAVGAPNPGGSSAASSASVTGAGGAIGSHNYDGSGGGGAFGGGAGGAGGAFSVGDHNGAAGSNGNTDTHQYVDATGSIHAYFTDAVLRTLLTNYPGYGSGDDTLDGGGGSDELFGLGGNDIFVFDLATAGAADSDRVWDFSSGDHLQLKNDATTLDEAALQAILNLGTVVDADADGRINDTRLVFSDTGKQISINLINASAKVFDGSLIFQNRPTIAVPTTSIPFTEQTAVVASSGITINDADGDADWNGGKLKVQITANFEAADNLRLATSNPGGSGIWLDTTGNQLMAGATQIGTADAASVDNGAAWIFSFTANATNAFVQATAQAMQFNNSSDTPGTGNRAVTFTATDKNAAAVSGAQTITVTAVNDAPAINGVPGTAQAVTVGTAATLADFAVADVDDTTLHVTLTAGNGTINGVTDSDNGSLGIQLTGTAAAINTVLAAATFTATAAGAASIGVSVSDGALSTSASYSLTASAPPTPAPAPDPTPVPTPVLDNDGVPDAQENTAPGLTLANGGVAVAGDGNGDGVADSQQSAVTSVSFLNTPTAQSNPASAPPVYVTLVAGAVNGKTDSTSTHSAALNNVHQLDAPANLPADIKMPLGLIAFTASVQTAGIAETFSLYIDPTLGVNGYWKASATGTWVNLASAAHGGKTVLEGGKLRLDFSLTDGGEFDADGKADGVITDPGAAGFMPLSIVGYAPELAAGTHFWF